MSPTNKLTPINNVFDPSAFSNASKKGHIFSADITLGKKENKVTYTIKYRSSKTEKEILSDNIFQKRVNQLIDLHKSLSPSLATPFGLHQSADRTTHVIKEIKNGKEKTELSTLYKELQSKGNKSKILNNTLLKIEDFLKETHTNIQSPKKNPLKLKHSLGNYNENNSSQKVASGRNKSLVKESMAVIEEGMVALGEEGKNHLEKSREAQHSKKKLKSKEVAREHANVIFKERPYCPPLKTGDGKAWIALRVAKKEDKYSVIDNEIYTTSERATSKEDGREADLPNIYYHIDSDNKLSLSCGVIDTKNKANMFMAAIIHILKNNNQIENVPLRINMHQLNSVGAPGIKWISEHALVKNQHLMVDYINFHLKETHHLGEGPFVAHINRCINGFTNIPGESESALPNNMLGIATQLAWFLEDNKIIPNLPNATLLKGQLNLILQRKSKLFEIDEQKKKIESRELKNLGEEVEKSISELDENLTIITDSLEERKANEAQLKVNSKEIEILKKERAQIEAKTASLNVEYKNLLLEETQLKALNKETEKKVAKELKNLSININSLFHTETNEENKAKLGIVNQLLAIQTHQAGHGDFPPKISPTQELCTQFLFDKLLGVVTQINCKSGLDRTGFARSLLIALNKKFHEPKMNYARLFNFVNNFEKTVKSLDKSIRLSKKQTRLHETFSYKEWLEQNSAYKSICNFQNEVFYQLCNVAIPITERSTNLPGLKWHHDKTTINPFEKNRHPLPFLPNYILTDDKKTEMPIITHSVNRRRKLTKQGIALLMGRSSERDG